MGTHKRAINAENWGYDMVYVDYPLTRVTCQVYFDLQSNTPTELSA